MLDSEPVLEFLRICQERLEALRKVFHTGLFALLLLGAGGCGVSFKQAISEEDVFSVSGGTHLLIPPSFGVRPLPEAVAGVGAEGQESLRRVLLAQDFAIADETADTTADPPGESLSGSAAAFLDYLGDRATEDSRAVAVYQNVVSLPPSALDFVLSAKDTGDSFEEKVGDPLYHLEIHLGR